MEIYTMSQVESLTGIKSTTLRAWERRYSFLSPQRTNTNIRHYSDLELRTLLNISILRENGYRISKIDQLTEDEIFDAVFDIIESKSPGNKEEILTLTNAMLAMDELMFSKVFNVHARREGLLPTMFNLIYPFLAQVGVLWTSSKVSAAQEHFISNLIRQKIIASIDELPAHKPDAPTIVMFLPEHEMHEIGLMLAHFVAKHHGWKVIYLGQNVPFDTLLSTTDKVRPQLIMTIAISSRVHYLSDLINRIRTETDLDLVLSGPSELFESHPMLDQIIYVSNPEEFKELLNERNQLRS